MLTGSARIGRRDRVGEVRALIDAILERMADTISFARGAPSLDIVDVEGLKRGRAARVRRRTPAARPPTARRSATCRCASGSPSSTASSADQVLVTNGSMQADAFLFELLVGPGDAVVVESPTYDRTLLNLRNRGADVRMVELETDGIDVDALAALLDERRVARSSRTSSPTSRTRPATR